MGTFFRVVTYSTDRPKTLKTIGAALDKAEKISQIATDYEADSELNQLCDAPINTPIFISDTLFDLLQRRCKSQKSPKDPTTPLSEPPPSSGARPG